MDLNIARVPIGQQCHQSHAREVAGNQDGTLRIVIGEPEAEMKTCPALEHDEPGVAARCPV
jgi:hypothetical protein